MTEFVLGGGRMLELGGNVEGKSDHDREGLLRPAYVN